jgi:hypothetical protein
VIILIKKWFAYVIEVKNKKRKTINNPQIIDERKRKSDY